MGNAKPLPDAYGHTLHQSFEAVESVTGIKIKKSFVDLGYSGSNVKEKSKVYTPKTRKKLSQEGY